MLLRACLSVGWSLAILGIGQVTSQEKKEVPEPAPSWRVVECSVGNTYGILTLTDGVFCKIDVQFDPGFNFKRLGDKSWDIRVTDKQKAPQIFGFHKDKTSDLHSLILAWEGPGSRVTAVSIRLKGETNWLGLKLVKAGDQALVQKPNPVKKAVVKTDDTKAKGKVDAEEKAAEMLRAAEKLLADGFDVLARVRLQAIVDDYPGTSAAAQATKLLEKFKKK